jgi:hypothetical protein
MAKLQASVVLLVFCLGAMILSACGGIAPKPEQPFETGNGVVALPTERFGFPVEYLGEKNDCYEIRVSYPYLGRPVLDRQVRTWVDSIYNSVKSEFQAICKDASQFGGRLEFMLDYEMFNTLHVISVVLHSYIYTGGAHGIDGVQAMNMRVSNGDILSYNDLFVNTEDLWVFFSDYVYERLRPELGQIWFDTPQFSEGLEPEESSFRNFVITPEGLTLYFPTYQIAPFSAGPQQCGVPLRYLVRFVPKPGIWQ